MPLTDPRNSDPVENGAARNERVSVVYFHGMGSQRRFEETSRLVDRIDTYLDAAYARGKRLGNLANIHARAEPGLDDDHPDVSFIRAIHLREFKNWDGPLTHVRFYESYWADEMREERSLSAVIKWILRQVWRPVTMIWTPWAERQRLRRAMLMELRETPEHWPDGTLETDFDTLLDLYLGFDHPNWTRLARKLEARNNETIGKDFDGFLRMIEVRNAEKPGRIERLKTLAKAWRSRLIRREIGNFALMSSLLLAILLIVLVAATAALAVLVRLPQLLAWVGLARQVSIPDWAQASWPNAIALGFGVLLVLGLRGFLVNRLADVEAWSTYSETDEKFAKREAVLKKSVDLLSHVCQQEDCDRVVVVSHSLGTSVAYDTLLAAVHANRAVNSQDPMTGRVDFTKISHFVTLASPVDTISYFFESFRSPVRRYRKVYDEMRGDIGKAPFTKSGGQPQIHWLNIWDRADIISGPLHTPTSAKPSDARIDNIHVNTQSYFNPASAHNAYFDHYGVVELLFDVILCNCGCYTSRHVPARYLPNGQRKGLDYRAVDFGPGAGAGTWSLAWLSLVLAPWGWLSFLLARYAGAASVATVAFWLAILFTALPLVGVLRRVGLKSGLSDPLE